MRLRAVLEPRTAAAAVLPDERDEQSLDEHEDREDEDRDEKPAVTDPLGVRRLGRHRRELGQVGEERHRLPFYERAGGLVSGNARTASADVVRPFEVFVNGVGQREGADYRIDGRTLVFERELKTEGKLGFWRWLSLWVGIAGTYRQNDSVDVAYQRNGKPVVATRLPLEPLD